MNWLIVVVMVIFVEQGGVVLGPSILGQNTAFLTNMFPKRGRYIVDTFSVFGLTLFIFLIGVKMDPGMVLRSGRKASLID